MKYSFTEEADKSISGLGEKETRELLKWIEEAAEEDFYNHESYSFVYDHHRRPWDKLDAKNEILNHRIFFREIGEKVVVLEIFDRNEVDYEDGGLYSQLEEIVEKNKR